MNWNIVFKDIHVHGNYFWNNSKLFIHEEVIKVSESYEPDEDIINQSKGKLEKL